MDVRLHRGHRLGLIRRLAAALALLATLATAGTASAGCLGPDQQRAAIAAGRVISLGSALQSVGGGKLISARLCESGGGYVYVLTLLRQDGKVVHVTVNASR